MEHSEDRGVRRALEAMVRTEGLILRAKRKLGAGEIVKVI